MENPWTSFQSNGSISPVTHAQGAKAGRQLMSLIGASYGNEAGAIDDSIEQQDVKEQRPLQPWQQSGHEDPADESTTCSMLTPMDMNVVLEDMSESTGHWDQFEVNEKCFGVKTTFQQDLSQYTTRLQIAEVPQQVKEKAHRIAREIEEDHKVNANRDSDGYNCAVAADGYADEEAKFSSVCREVIQLQ